MPTRAWFHIKGLADRLVALVALPILAIPMLVVAFLVRRDSPGPALFRQQRAGHAGVPFTAYKFRTMRVDECDGNSSVIKAQTIDDDERITRLGRSLRRMRIDELPQLINVLKGEMSLIGPRPEPKVLTDWYEQELPFYRLRHVVKPGISGWAQVNQGHVNGIDQAQVKLHYDFYYIKYFSPWLDLIILFRTISTMLGRKGAR
ncbi:sugar transferase [Sphingomicrobium sp. B8]|uniref:Sugar transferase n=2 Tax=Sphingomicrobium clamense TaxID=2851013 RepID=A0ABS6V6U3_9SPHN|nr:sugar transferase [Sphingomicrobium sp. B8]